MPIDPTVALAAEPATAEIEWRESDVVLYHLAIGGGRDPLDPRALAAVTERGDGVLASFALVAPTLRVAAPPRMDLPGLDIDLRSLLHAGQRIEVHRPIPRDGTARLSTGVSAVYDKGSAAIVVLDTEAADADGAPLWTSSMRLFVRGEGGFGGDRGPDGPPGPPDRAPDHVLDTTTLPQQALLYRLLGDRNPMHSDPDFATAAGFPRPILHGLCTYGAVLGTIVEELLDGAMQAVVSLEARFAGVVFPGETLRTSVWAEAQRLSFTTSVLQREDAVALTGGVIELTAPAGGVS